MYLLTTVGSTPNTLFPLERNFFHWQKGWNESQRQCTKSAETSAESTEKFSYCTDIYVYNNSGFLFHFFGIWLSVKYKYFLIFKTFLKFSMFLFDFIKTNSMSDTKVQHICCTLTQWPIQRGRGGRTLP